MYEHLQHFLEKIAAAQTGGPALVPSFPPASSTNMGMATPPPQPDLGSIKAFDMPVKPGAPKGISAGGSGSKATSAAAPSAPSAPSGGKTGAVRSATDFTSQVRGPLSDTRKEQYTSPFDDPIEWGAPTSVEGGDAGTRHAPAGSTHPDVKIAAGLGTFARGGAAVGRAGLKAFRRTLGLKPRAASGMDVLSTGASPALLSLPKAGAGVDVSQAMRRGVGQRGFTGFGK